MKMKRLSVVVLYEVLVDGLEEAYAIVNGGDNGGVVARVDGLLGHLFHNLLPGVQVQVVNYAHPKHFALVVH